MLPQQYCLRWRYHHSNLQTMFSQLLEREAFCDVTLACEGRTIKAHKIVLSACSTYFETILSEYEEKDPILIMKDVKYVDIKCLVEFMYKGEINVDHCHLATLLKTAEELRIKGLAEVSWRDDDCTNTDGSSNGVQSALPNVSAVMETPKSETAVTTGKRKRGRPPIDDYEQSFTAPKIANVAGGTTGDDAYSNDAMSSSDHDLSIWEEESGPNEQEENADGEEVTVKVEPDQDNDDESTTDHTSASLNDTLNTTIQHHHNRHTTKASGSMASTASSITAALEKEWPDVIKMNDYLNTGRRQQFWEEPFTKRVMDAIKTKNLEMKIAAELLGVSYGTLYGRYRDAYGCLKHPYRVRDFWTEQGPTDILLKLKRKEITLFRAAEQLNVTPQTLSNYLISMSQLDSEAQLSGHSHPFEGANTDTDEDSDSILPDLPPNSTIFKNVMSAMQQQQQVATATTTTTGNSVLANCPDITIIKKDKLEGLLAKVNNNSSGDHSGRESGSNGEQSHK